MTRLVEFRARGVVTLSNFYGLKVFELVVNDSVQLPLNPPKTYYRFNDAFFAICEGEGALYYKDYPQALNFSDLDPLELEGFLLHQKSSCDRAQQQLIKQFINVYDKNIEKGFLYLNPPFFSEVERELFYAQCV
ncbi:hypothetical protein [Helicobacter bizzozeronii]|uniref:hypothetical protein n=1 Tax=Helicobacter bizzozeronii TaxID=56877 RepID=UPI000CEF2977|nr:hypothetical protein [Helicobacter bizzozeronii]